MLFHQMAEGTIKPRFHSELICGKLSKLRRDHHFSLSDIFCLDSSHVNLGIIGIHKPIHHDKVTTQGGAYFPPPFYYYYFKILFTSCQSGGLDFMSNDHPVRPHGSALKKKNAFTCTHWKVDTFDVTQSGHLNCLRAERGCNEAVAGTDSPTPHRGTE